MRSFRTFAVIAAATALVAVMHPVSAKDPSAGMYQPYSGSDSSASFDRAFDTSPAASIDEVIKTLTRALDRIARYRVPKDPPPVFRIPHAELENYVCGTNCNIKAWYKPGEGIFLDDSLHPETNLFHRSILLHELVHYFQDRAGEYAGMDPCDRWFHRELDAYTIQNRYLGIIGHPSRVAYSGDNCSNMQTKERTPRQAFDGLKGRVDPDQH
jgi:hypothetical protein